MTDFAVFAQQIIDELTKEGRKHTADTRKHSANRILMFMGDNPTSMDKWDELFVQDYEAWMKAQGLTASTTAYYLSQLCTFYKQAVKKWNYSGTRHLSVGQQETATTKAYLSTVPINSRVALFANPRPSQIASIRTRHVFVLPLYKRNEICGYSLSEEIRR